MIARNYPPPMGNSQKIQLSLLKIGRNHVLLLKKFHKTPLHLWKIGRNCALPPKIPENSTEPLERFPEIVPKVVEILREFT